MTLWTADNAGFLKILQALLPHGVVWTREANRRLTRVLRGIADELVRINGRQRALIEEAIPATTTAAGMLEDWERVCGLPEYGYVPTDEAERRAVLCGKLAAQGGQAAPYFQAVAVSMGMTDAVVTDNELSHVWNIKSPAHVSVFRAGDRPERRTVSFDTPEALRVSAAMYSKQPAHTYIWWTD